MALKKIKSENKKTKVNKPEKTQPSTTKKNFNYFRLLTNWYNSALSAREIELDTDLSQSYKANTIAEDMKVAKVLLGVDKDVVISQEWREYLINFWRENPDTTWVKLHYCFAKTSGGRGARDCQDTSLLCNYIIDNGVTKEDVKNAIASQN